MLKKLFKASWSRIKKVHFISWIVLIALYVAIPFIVTGIIALVNMNIKEFKDLLPYLSYMQWYFWFAAIPVAIVLYLAIKFIYMHKFVNNKTTGEPKASIELRKFKEVSVFEKHDQDGYIIKCDQDGEKIKARIESDCHALILGGTRVGKTSGIIIPSLLMNIYSSKAPSMVVTDPKGEIYDVLLPHLKKQGFTIQCLNLIDTHKKNNKFDVKWNPLSEIYDRYRQEDQILALQQLQDLITKIIPAKISHSKDDYFATDARKLIKMIAEEMLMNFETTRNEFTFHEILSIVDSVDSLEHFLKRLNKKNPVFDKYTKANSAQYEGVRGTAATMLELFSNFQIQKITETSTFNWKNFRQTKNILFIKFNMDEEISRRYISLFLSNFYYRCYKNLITPKDTQKVYFFLDEFGNLPQIENFGQTFSLAAGYDLYFCIVLQSKSQLNQYNHGNSQDSQSQIIFDNINLIYILDVGKNEREIRDWSKTLGTREVVSKTTTKSASNTSVHESKKEVPYFSENVLRQLKLDKLSIVFSTNKLPIKIKQFPYYAWNQFQKKATNKK